MANFVYSDFMAHMQQIALSEGWLLLERDGYLEIQCFDGDPKQRFGGDNDAQDYVRSRAKEGSYMHQIAVQLDGTKVEG